MQQVNQISQAIFFGLLLVGLLGLAGYRLAATLGKVHTPARRRARGDRRLDALTLYLAAVGAYVIFGSLVQQVHLEAGLLLSQLLFLATPAVVVPWLGGAKPRQLLSLRGGQRLSVVAAMLMGLGTWLPVGLYVELQSWLVPLPAGYEQAFADMVLPDSPAEMILALGAFALVPGVCEELLFRGAILGMLRTGTSNVRAVVLTAALFGLMHLDPFRIVPTALLGLVLGAAVVRTGALWPAVALHLTHNASLLALGMIIGAEDADAPTWLVTLAVLCLALGAAGLFGSGPPRRARAA